MITFVGGTASAIGATADAVLSKSVSVRSMPGDNSGKLIGRMLIGESVKVQNRVGNSAQVQSAKLSGWVPGEPIVSIDTFRPVHEWNGPKTLAVGDGDYSASYKFNGDGTFVVTESESGSNKIYRTIERTGRLHSSGNFIWSQRSDVTLNASQVFVKTQTTKLCWQRQMDGRCGASP